MDEKRTETISPLIAKWHPHASPEEQAAYTEEWHAILLGFYRICEQAEAEGRLPDSPKSGSHAKVESVNPPTA